MPGHARISSASSVDAADLGRDRRRARASIASSVVGAQVADQLAGAGDDVERVAGVQHGRHGGQVVGAVGVVAAGDGLRGGGEREQRVAAAVGRRAGVGGAAARRRPGSCRPPCGARRRPPRRRRRARRPRSTGTRPSRRSARRGANGAGPPLLVADEQQRDLGVVLAAARRARAGRRARARRRPSCRPCRSRPASRRRARAAGGRRGRRRCRGGRAAGSGRAPVPARRASRSGAWSGEEHGMRSSCGLVGQQRGAHRRRTPRRRGTSPEGEETADERLELARRAAGDLRRRLADPRRPSGGQRYPATVYGRCPSCPRWRSPPAGSSEALPGETIESALAPGINALKTFDPPLSALEGATITGVRRRGKLLLLDRPGGLTLLMHLMSAGRLQLFPKRALADATARRAWACGCPRTASCGCASSAPSSARG